MAFDAFLHLASSKGDIKGETLDNTHKDEIDLIKFTLDIHGPDLDVDKAESAGQVTFNNAELELYASAATTTLFYCCCTGELLKTATITCRKPGGGGLPVSFLQWRFHKVQVATYKIQTDSHLPKETVTLKYAKLEVSYAKQKQDGTLENPPRTAGWDASVNQSLKPTLPYGPGKK